MKFCYLMILLQLVMPSVTAKRGHTAKEVVSYLSTSAIAGRQPDAVVRQLYSQVVARRPLGIPTGADKTAIWPLLSKRLLRRFEVAQACEDDYVRQHAGDDGKPELAWLELGLFSGANEMALPAAVVVERTESQEDGAFRVYMQFTYKESFETYGRPPDPAATFHWHGASIVRSESGQFVVDDVLLFKKGSRKIESRLSHTLTLGCNGPRWAGYGSVRSR